MFWKVFKGELYFDRIFKLPNIFFKHFFKWWYNKVSLVIWCWFWNIRMINIDSFFSQKNASYFFQWILCSDNFQVSEGRTFSSQEDEWVEVSFWLGLLSTSSKPFIHLSILHPSQRGLSDKPFCSFYSIQKRNLRTRIYFLNLKKFSSQVLLECSEKLQLQKLSAFIY